MKRILFLSLIWIITQEAFSSSNREYARFDHYTTENGLSSNLVFSLAQDSTGFLWISTDFGLDRFDGAHFKHFCHSKYPSMHRDDIYYVDHLGSNEIVIGAFCGTFQYYDRERDVFIDFMPPELESLGYSQIKGVKITENGERYLFSNEHVFKYDKEKNEYNSNYPAFDSLQSHFISTLHKDSYNHYWMGSINDLTIYDENGHKLYSYNSEHDDCHYVSRILPISKEKIAIGFFDSQLWLFDIADVTHKEVIHLPFRSITKMIKSKSGRFWFATDGDGLWYADSLNAKTTFKTVVPYNTPFSDIKKIYDVIESVDGTIWMGTQNSGIWAYHPSETSNLVFSGDFGFPSIVCTSFAEDGNGNIIIGTDGNGIYSVSSDFRSFKQYNLSSDNVTGLTTSNGKMLVSTWGGSGLSQFDSSKGTFKNIGLDTISNPTNLFFDIAKLPDGTIYGCSANDDLYMKRPSSLWEKVVLHDDSFPQLSSKWIARVYKGAGNLVWVLATNMLWQYDGTTVRAIKPELFQERSHSPYTIYDADCDENGNLYVTTNEGIFCYSSDGEQFDTLSYIPKDTYRIICYGKKDQLWLASHNAIISFNPEEKTIEYLPGNYNDMFYIKAKHKDSKGNIFLGTMNGFYTFNPSRVLVDSAIQHLSFSELYISKEKVLPYTSFLKNGNLSDLHELFISYGHTNMDIIVDVIDYARFNKAQLRYRLKGLQDKWIPLEESKTISFNYLPTGTFTLEVEAIRPNMKFYYPPISLTIHVLPPWWNSWWFRTIIGLIILLGITIFIKKKITRLKNEKARLKQEMEKQAEILNQTKRDREKLIAALSHDLRNPSFSVVGEKDDKEQLTLDEIIEMIVDKSILEENTILVVNQDAQTRTEIDTMLNDYFHVLDANNSEEAYLMAEENVPDIIVSDIDMLESSGAEMSKKLSSSDSTKHIPILFVSSKNDEEDRLLGLMCGAIDYIAKPFNQLELLLKLTNILKIRQEHQKIIMQASMSQRVKAQALAKNEEDRNDIHPFLQSFMDVVSKQYKDNETTVESLANTLSVSKPTLTRRVKSMTGKTPMEWLMEYRLSRSLQILQDPNSGKTISEVAYEVGFSDPSYFTKKFRDFYGVLPSQSGKITD